MESITTLGCWGNLFQRYFLGALDDVRFSSEALYLENFKPECPDLNPNIDTKGLWNFNERNGDIAYDSSINGNHGMLSGCTRIWADICQEFPIGDPEQLNAFSLKAFPNPSDGLFKFELNELPTEILEIKVFNTYGQLVKIEEITTATFELNLEDCSQGAYFYQIVSDRMTYSGSLVIRK